MLVIKWQLVYPSLVKNQGPGGASGSRSESDKIILYAPWSRKRCQGGGVNFLKVPTSFPQAPSCSEHSQKGVEGGGGVPAKKM